MTDKGSDHNDEDLQEDEGTHVVPERSSVAERIERVRSATLKAAEKREHLPQQLFWSLFHAELEEIRKEKKLKRALNDIFNP